MTRLCQSLQCLPGAGGLYDQDYKYVWIIRKVLSADIEYEKRQKALKGTPEGR